MPQPTFFISWMFCHIHTDRNRWACFGEGLLYKKQQKYTSFHSWGAKAAWLDLFIPILGALVYHSNHKYSDRYSSYWNWSLDCNANGSLKYCWNCCLGSSVLDLVLHHYSCWTKLLWKLSSQEASVCAADSDPWDRWSRDLFIFFLSDLFFLLSVIRGGRRKQDLNFFLWESIPVRILLFFSGIDHIYVL